MKSVLTAETTVFLKFKSIGIVLFVLLCVVVSLLTFSTDQSNLNSCIISHLSGTSIFKIFDCCLSTQKQHKQTRVRVPPSPSSVPVAFRRGANAHKKSLLAEVKILYHFTFCVSRLFLNFILFFINHFEPLIFLLCSHQIDGAAFYSKRKLIVFFKIQQIYYRICSGYAPSK